MVKLKSLLLVSLVASAPLSALAHGPRVGVHGGQQMAAGSFHVEVVAEGKTLTVYLADHAAHEIPTAGFKGVAFIDVDDKTLTIPLTAAGSNKLSGVAEAPLAAQFKGIVRFTTQTGSSTEAKF